jgi:hypothetical protein
MRSLPIAAAAGLAFAAVLATPGAAMAAPPNNDTYAGRTIVGSLPFSETLDTTEATTDADDAAFSAISETRCGLAVTTDASVWYEVTAADDGGIDIDVRQSTYDAGAVVATGSPGNWAGVACGAERIGWEAEPGVTYTILVFDRQFDGGGNGGTLSMTIDHVIDVTADSVATLHPTSGSATVSGTMWCRAGESGAVEANLSQIVGNSTVRGTDSTPLSCDGTTHPWTVEILPFSGRFSRGQATLTVFGILDSTLASDAEIVTVVLRR